MRIKLISLIIASRISLLTIAPQRGSPFLFEFSLFYFSFSLKIHLQTEMHFFLLLKIPFFCCCCFIKIQKTFQDLKKNNFNKLIFSLSFTFYFLSSDLLMPIIFNIFIFEQCAYLCAPGFDRPLHLL